MILEERRHSPGTCEEEDKNIHHQRKRTRGYVPEDALTFGKEGSETSPQPHNNALVTFFLIRSFQIKHVLLNSGGSTNIIGSRVIGQLGLPGQIMPASQILGGFSTAIETTREETIFSVSMAGADRNAKFHIVKGDSRYKRLVRTAADAPLEGGTVPSSPNDEITSKGRN